MRRLQHFLPVFDALAQTGRRVLLIGQVPDQLPYTRQTSTKLLEYCAAGLRVVSTDYAWVREFEQQHEARFAYIPYQASVAAYRTCFGPALDQQALQVPDVRSLAWPRLLAGLQIWRQLGIPA